MNGIDFIMKTEPVTDIERYRSGLPSDGVEFCGSLRKHPWDRERCLLITGQSTSTDSVPHIYEFRLADILFAEEAPSSVDENGTSLMQVKIWVRRGSIGIQYEPFEVDTPIKPAFSSKHFRPAAASASAGAR